MAIDILRVLSAAELAFLKTFSLTVFCSSANREPQLGVQILPSALPVSIARDRSSGE